MDLGIIFESSPDFIIITDPESGTIINANTAFLEGNDVTLEEIAGKKTTESGLWINEKDRDRFISEIINNGHCENLESQVKLFNGKIKTVLINGRITEFKGKKYIISISKDISEFKEIESKLRANEHRLRMINENIRDVIFRYNLRNDRIEYISPSAFLGDIDINKTAIKKGFFESILNKKTRDLVISSLQQMKEGILIPSLEFIIDLPGGEEKWIHQRNALVSDESGNPLFLDAVMTDITSEKIIREQTDRNAALLKATIESSGEGIMVINLKGEIILFNQQFSNIRGIPVQWDNMKSVEQRMQQFLTIVKDPDVFKSRLDYLLANPHIISIDFIELIDGRVLERNAYPFYLGDELSGRLFIFKDITQQKYAENALIESEERYRLLAEHSNDIISRYDDEGRISYISPACFRMLGYKPEDMTGRKQSDFIHPEDMNGLSKALNTYDGTKSNLIYSYRFRKKNGDYIWLETNYSLIRNPDTGKIDEIFLVSRDITEKRKAEKLIREKERAELSSKAKSEFLAHMSHEIRNPMNIIVGMSNNLKKTPLSRQQNVYVESLSYSCNHLLDIINDILDISKIEANKVELTESSFLLEDLCADIRYMYESHSRTKKIGFSAQNNTSISSPLMGDISKIKQILINLISNAFKFTEEGSVSFRIKEKSNQRDKHILLFEVQDTGKGIQKADQDKIFETFKQVDSSTTKAVGGTGLGLSIAMKFAELMNAKLWLESEMEKGSTFFLEIPLKKAKASIAQKEDEMKDLPEKINILLAEDDALNRIYLSGLLQDKFWNVDSVNNGKKALEKSKKSRFDLILLDGQMPVMDGFEACRKIRSDKNNPNQNAPVIAITGYAVKGDRERFIDAGMNEYITKPINERHLFQLIQNLLEKS